MSGRTIGIMGVLALVLGVSLLAVPVAFADSPQDYPSVMQSRSATTADVPVALGDIPQEYPSVVQSRSATADESARPDDLAGPRGPGAFASEPTTVVVATTESGFDWTDAVIGGAVVFGVVLLTGLAAWTATHHGPTAGRHAPT